MALGIARVVAIGPYALSIGYTESYGSSALVAANYQLAPVGSSPALVVRAVVADELDPLSVRMATDRQTFAGYTLLTPGVTNGVGGPLVPASSPFSGWSDAALFSVRPVGATVVDVLFAHPMVASGALSNSSSYDVRDLSGNVVAVVSATPNTTTNPVRVRLALAAPLGPTKPYVVRAGLGLATVDGRLLVPGAAIFSWLPPARKASIPLTRFTGEVRNRDVPLRDVFESLALRESVTVVLDVARPVQSKDPLTTFSFSSTPFDRVRVSVQGASFDVTLEPPRSLGEGLLVRSVPFDPERPNATTLERLALSESVGVSITPPVSPPGPSEGTITLRVAAPSGTEEIVEPFFFGEALAVLPTSTAHQVAVTEALSGSASVTSGRERVGVVAADVLAIGEALVVLPDLGPGLAPSTRALFGNPNGQVFFSPALVPGGSVGSILQVDDVSVCTKAYDTYRFPVTEDPNVFTTHGASVVPVGGSLLNGPDVLVTGFYRLREAQHNLTLRPTDRVTAPVDLGATMTLKQTYDPARFSLLNNAAWHLADGSGLSFVVADNLSPLGPPVVAPTRHFINPGEVLTLGEVSTRVAAHGLTLAETLTRAEALDLAPGFGQHVASVSEALTLGEAFLSA
jgi:hypothetical protein